MELGAKGIRGNCIIPGPIESRMMASIEEGARPGAAPTVHDGFAATIPMKRYGMPDEVASAVAFMPPMTRLMSIGQPIPRTVA